MLHPTRLSLDKVLSVALRGALALESQVRQATKTYLELASVFSHTIPRIPIKKNIDYLNQDQCGRQSESLRFAAPTLCHVLSPRKFKPLGYEVQRRSDDPLSN